MTTDATPLSKIGRDRLLKLAACPFCGNPPSHMTINGAAKVTQCVPCIGRIGEMFGGTGSTFRESDLNWNEFVRDFAARSTVKGEA